VAAEGTLRANVRALPRAAWFVYAGTFVNRFGSFVLVFLALYLTKHGFTPAQAGLAVGAYGAGSLGAALLGGSLADSIGRRRTIALSMFGSAATMVALSQATALWLLVALAVVAGLTAELYRPAAGALLADLVPEGQRVAAFGVYRFAINLGFAFGPAVAGLLADRSFTAVFLGDALTSVVYGVIALAFLPEGTHTRVPEERRGEGFRTILADPPFLVFLAASLGIAFVYQQANVALPLHVHHAGLSNATYGALLSLNGVLIVLLELPLIAFTQHRPPVRTIALGQLLVGLGFGLTAFAHSPGPLAATVVVWTFGEMIGAPPAGAYVASLAPEHLRGRYQGAWSLMWALGLVLGPTIGGVLFQHGESLLWGVCLLLGVGSAALLVAGPHRREAAPEAAAAADA
jgi:MFS family permease